MARQDALSILNGVNQDKLAETYGKVIEAVQKGAVSMQIKNQNYSGDPTTGSVEISRFANATVKPLGTARAAGAGDKLNNKGKVTININQDKEIIEELAVKDIKLSGFDNLVDKRTKNHAARMIANLDTAFFAEAESAGTAVTLQGTTIQEKVEELIQSIETVQNDFVDGVDREMIVLTLKPSVYGQLENYMDSVPNTLTGLKDNYFHRVRVFSNVRQTKSMICMLDGAVGQPVTSDVYEAEKIGLSNDIALELFYSYGTKAVTPDLIKHVA